LLRVVAGQGLILQDLLLALFERQLFQLIGEGLRFEVSDHISLLVQFSLKVAYAFLLSGNYFSLLDRLGAVEFHPLLEFLYHIVLLLRVFLVVDLDP
jgi:hypothetical protein